jgi:DNA-binding MarR family transcriptional regulator
MITIEKLRNYENADSLTDKQLQVLAIILNRTNVTDPKKISDLIYTTVNLMEKIR